MDADPVSVALEEIQALRQRLLYATLEKETLRTNAMNELRLKEDCVNQLYRLLKQTTFERDEARQHLLQLQHLLLPKTQTTQTQTSPPSDPLVDLLPLPPSLHFPITSTDSDNHSSYISSPVDSIFDVVVSSSAPSDHLDRLMNSRPLPEMGKLMQAVADTGPLLKTLLVAGPLPRWRNPPPPPPPSPVQAFQMAPAVGLSGRKRPAMSGLGPDAKRLLKEALSGC